jgi:mono/diheme cytochrome c family protein
MYSRHFPDEVQGDFLICNSIGFLGIKQHKIWEDGAGYTGELRQDMLYSNDPNFRPCDIETAPDGSLYVIDWHNTLIGQMQHSARDPNRDNDHGRIYRITYPSRPLLEPAKIDGASLSQLFENLKAHEYRTRYRTRREIRGHDASKVLPAIKKWAARLKKSDPNYNRHLLEALWVTWGQNQVDEKLLAQCLKSKSYDVRSAAIRVLRYAYRQIDNYQAMFMKAAVDEHPRVRLESVVAASWMDNDMGARIAAEGLKKPVTKWMGPAYEAIMWTLGDRVESLALLGKLDISANPNLASYLAGTLEFYDKTKMGDARSVPQTNVPAAALETFNLGLEVFNRDAHCVTCHAENGKGAIENIYPPLNVNKWINGSEDRLIKMVLKGLLGPIEVDGKMYDPTGVPPMTGFEGILTDEEIAAVITYVKIQFGNPKGLSKIVDPANVARVREEVKDKTGFYMVDEILEMHPHN